MREKGAERDEEMTEKLYPHIFRTNHFNKWKRNRKLSPNDVMGEWQIEFATKMCKLLLLLLLNASLSKH